jgi:ubiquinone/menaquinone biosynthesis C-methylase UbiE
MSADVQRAFYNRLYGTRSASGQSRLNRLVARFELHRTDAVASLVEGGGYMLDVGSGAGALIERCASRFEHLTGIDVSDIRVATAAKDAVRAGLNNVSFAVANVDVGLPLQDASVDVATVVAVLGFIFDPIALLDELHRVLRPNGQLVVEVLNLAYLPRRFALLSGRLPRHSTADGWDGGHLHNFTQAALAEALPMHGFGVERWTGSGVLAPVRTWWPSLLTGNLIADCRRL